MRPFEHAVEIKDRSGNVLAAARASYWKTDQSPSAVAESYDYGGVVTEAAREQLVGKRNRLLVSETGEVFNVVEATYHDVLRYVEVELRQSNPDG